MARATATGQNPVVLFSRINYTAVIDYAVRKLEGYLKSDLYFADGVGIMSIIN